MTDASEEIRRRAEAIAFKIQATRHKEMIEEFRTRDEEQQRRMEQLLDLIADIHVAETTETARRIEETKAETARRIEEKAAMQPYRDLEDVRTAFWIILHRPPFTMVHETFLEEFSFSTGLSMSALARSWKTGEFTTNFPPGDDLAHITVIVDWKPEENPNTPRLHWMIQAPNSLYYPGDHFGRFELRRLRHRGGFSIFNESNPSKLKPFSTRLEVRWMSPVLSPFPSSTGAISSVGPLEETSAHTILTATLHSIAHTLVHGPFASMKAPIFRLHEMAPREARYFRKGADGRSTDEEKCIRATALFANAFNRSSDGNPDALDFLGLPRQCREISVMAIRELLEFYDLSAQVAEKALGDVTWQLEECYNDITTQHEWVVLDRQWATRIAELAKFEFILKAAKEQASVVKMRMRRAMLDTGEEDGYLKAVWPLSSSKQGANASIESAWSLPNQPSQGLTGSTPADAPKPVVGTPIAGVVRNRPDGMPVCLADDGLPRDWTDLHRAIWHEDCNTTLLLADHTSVRQRDDVGYTPLHLACSRTGSLLFTFRQVYDRGLSTLMTANRSGLSSLMTANRSYLECLPFRRDYEAAAVEMVGTLIAAGADPNAEAWPARSVNNDKFPWTPMHCAANSGWMDVASLLLEHGGSAFSRTMCSPFCWVDEGHRRFAIEGQPSNVRDLLGSYLSSEQVDAINALHSEQGFTGDLVYPVFSAQVEK